MANQINYVPLLPKEPPEDLVQWALEQGALNKEYLIYRDGKRYLPLEDRWENCVDVVCSACGNEFHATKCKTRICHNQYAPAPFGWWNEEMGESVISGNGALCPYCGAKAETKHIGAIRDVLTERVWVAVIDRLPVEGETDRLMIVDWMIARDTDKHGDSKYWTHLYSAWIVEEKKIVRIAGQKRNFYVTSLTKPEQRASFHDDFGKAQMIYPWSADVLIGTTAENSKLEIYQEAGGERLIAYLGLYLKKPAVENLVMQGMAPLVKTLLDTECESTTYRQQGGYPKLQAWIDWKEKKPAKMLGMNRDQLRIFKEQRWGADQLRAIAWARVQGISANWPEGIDLIYKYGTYNCERMLKDQPKELFWKIIRYTNQQGHGYDFLRDYWNMAKQLEMDLDDEQVRWPKSLKSAHDKATERYNARKDEIASAAFAKRVTQLKHLCWEQDGLMIRPCASMTELRNEGKLLHHCVATYDKRYAEGRTAIFFIRRIDQPDQPFYTLELDEENLIVRQNRGLRNCGKTEEVQAFEDAWMNWAKSQKNKKKRKVKAA